MRKKTIVSSKERKSARCESAIRATVFARVYRKQVARQLIGKVARDFDEMLHSMLGALDMMRARIDLDKIDEIGSLVDATGASLYRAAILSRKLTAMSRAKACQSVHVNVNAVISSMTVLLRSMVGFEVECEFRLGKNLPNTHCDAGHLETLLFSLALDARNAIVGRGKILIETCLVQPRQNLPGSKSRAFLEICVSDTGAIMPVLPARPAKSDDAVEVPAGRTSVVMAQDFVGRLRGRVCIDQHPEAGTSVTMRLPCQVGEYGKCNPPPAFEVLRVEVADAETIYHSLTMQPRRNGRGQPSRQGDRVVARQCNLATHAQQRNTDWEGPATAIIP